MSGSCFVFFFLYFFKVPTNTLSRKKSESSDVMITVLCVYKSCYYMMQLE